MLGVQLAGYAAFICASVVLGGRLLLLWRRTGGLPELATGTAFLLGGGVGYVCWLLLAVIGASEEAASLSKVIGLVGLGANSIGGMGYGLGTAHIFRSGERWPIAGIVAFGCVMAAGWLSNAMTPAGQPSLGFWVALMATGCLYLWGAIESLMLARVLDKRARLGMASPLLVNRTAQWGLAALTITSMVALASASHFIFGEPGPVWVATLTACLGLVAAAAIWLGFFPPQGLQARILRAYGS